MLNLLIRTSRAGSALWSAHAASLDMSQKALMLNLLIRTSRAGSALWSAHAASLDMSQEALMLNLLIRTSRAGSALWSAHAASLDMMSLLIHKYMQLCSEIQARTESERENRDNSFFP
jgi:hypothetical protein